MTIRSAVEKWYIRPTNHSDINQEEKESLIKAIEDEVRKEINTERDVMLFMFNKRLIGTKKG